MEKEKSCGAVIYRIRDDQIEFLLIKQKNGKHYGFPKGHQEYLESDVETAIREVREEVGLHIDINDQIHESTHFHPREGVNKEVIYFLGTTKTESIQIQTEEIEDASWLNAGDILRMLTFDNDRKMFLSLIKRGNLYG